MAAAHPARAGTLMIGKRPREEGSPRGAIDGKAVEAPLPTVAARRVATYSKRVPFATVRAGRRERSATPTTICQDIKARKGASPGAAAERAAAAAEGEKWLEAISLGITEGRGHDVPAQVPAPPLSSAAGSHGAAHSRGARSRLSEIRPRQSICPSAHEFEELLRTCKQTSEASFREYWEGHIKAKWPLCAKIGESSFSEVFMMSSNVAAASNACTPDVVAVKIMPVLRPGGGVPMSAAKRSPEPVKLSNLLHEIRTLVALEGLRQTRKYATPSGYTGFNQMIRCAVVSGPFPNDLLSEWDQWAVGKGRGSAYNDRPDFYDEDSVHVILVMNFGGVDLENFAIRSLAQLRSITVQILTSISLAEEHLFFEHRDLHLGNVLVRETHRSDVRLENYRTIPTEGVLCSIIDYSLSRFTDRAARAPQPGISTYRDLELDDWLFGGDAGESNQYQMYRNMRAITGEDWEGFYPATNTLWIGYIVGEMLASKHVKALAKRDSEALQQWIDFATILPSIANCKEALKHVPSL